MKNLIAKTSIGLAAVAIALASPVVANAVTGSGSGTGSETGAAGTATTSTPAPGGESVLTGTTAAQVTKAALAAVPGATVQRVTTEHAGATNPYEAHLTKTDGTRVTVLIGSTFNVISIQADPGPGHKGGGESVLTGTTAAQVTKAALAAVPGATVQRVTTEHAGATNPYEAHLTKTDGTRVTVLIGSTFNVISIQADPGHR